LITSAALASAADELHLYVGFARPDAEADPVDRMTIEDFLVRLPSGACRTD
jgi:hypothetical protein